LKSWTNHPDCIQCRGFQNFNQAATSPIVLILCSRFLRIKDLHLKPISYYTLVLFHSQINLHQPSKIPAFIQKTHFNYHFVTISAFISLNFNRSSVRWFIWLRIQIFSINLSFPNFRFFPSKMAPNYFYFSFIAAKAYFNLGKTIASFELPQFPKHHLHYILHAYSHSIFVFVYFYLNN